MSPRPAAKTPRTAVKKASAKPPKGSVAAEDVRMQAKADRVTKYMTAARARQQELERGGMFF